MIKKHLGSNLKKNFKRGGINTMAIKKGKYLKIKSFF